VTEQPEFPQPSFVLLRVEYDDGGVREFAVQDPRMTELKVDTRLGGRLLREMVLAAAPYQIASPLTPHVAISMDADAGEWSQVIAREDTALCTDLRPGRALAFLQEAVRLIVSGEPVRGSEAWGNWALKAGALLAGDNAVPVRQRSPQEVREQLLSPSSPLPPELAQALADEICPEGQ